MTPAERYQRIALEFKAKATIETDDDLRTEWENLSAAYFRLADQAQRNALADIVYPTPLKPDALSEE